MVLTELKVKIPWIGSIRIAVDDTARRAAWELYVELATRIATVPLDLDHGLVREAMSSLHSLFGTTRRVLREAGPRVGRGDNSVGSIAIDVLDKGIRPFLAKWHPQLQTWEAGRPDGVGPAAHERAWEHDATVRGELEALRRNLLGYAAALRAIAKVDL